MPTFWRVALCRCLLYSSNSQCLSSLRLNGQPIPLGQEVVCRPQDIISFLLPTENPTKTLDRDAQTLSFQLTTQKAIYRPTVSDTALQRVRMFLEGSGEGSEGVSGEGFGDGSREGSREGSLGGSMGGSLEGSWEGSRGGYQDGSWQGSREGSRGGSQEGSRDWSWEGFWEGSTSDPSGGVREEPSSEDVFLTALEASSRFLAGRGNGESGAAVRRQLWECALAEPRHPVIWLQVGFLNSEIVIRSQFVTWKTN